MTNRGGAGKNDSQRSVSGDLLCETSSRAERQARPMLARTEEAAQVPPAPAVADHDQQLEDGIIEVLRRIFDPEIPVNIYDLGLVYGIDIYPLGRVTVRMTLTSPACPVAGSLPGEVEAAVSSVEGVSAANVELVWDPPWTLDMMSEEARLELNLI